jgi:hypothetical protein
MRAFTHFLGIGTSATSPSARHSGAAAAGPQALPELVRQASSRANSPVAIKLC